MLDRTYAGLVSRGFDILFKDRFILFFIYVYAAEHTRD